MEVSRVELEPLNCIINKAIIMKSRRQISVMVVALLLSFSPLTSAYDQPLAESYESYFEPFKGKATGKAMQQMPIPKFVLEVRSGSDFYLIDIRTPAESSIVGLTLPGTVAIPMNQLFRAENLARIPTDRKVVVTCKAGHRGMAVTTALRHIGFSNVYNLKGGVMALIKHLNPKTAAVKK